MTWRKSSFSGSETACVELAWRKSSRSGGETACVEVAWPVEEVAVRDSKNPAGPMLTFGRSALAALVATATSPRSVLSA